MDPFFYYLALVYVCSGVITAVLFLSLIELLGPWLRRLFFP